MEQTTQLKQTVEKLDRALTRLQEIQRALRGHSPLPLTTDPKPDKVPRQLSILYGLGDNYLVPSGSQRRWSMPAALTHDHALSEAVAVSKFAKKTVDMVKVQKKKQAAKNTNTPSSYSSFKADQTPTLQPSNRVNLPQQKVDMSASKDAGRKPRASSKENNRTPRQSEVDLKNHDTELLTVGVLRRDTSTKKPKSRNSRDETSSWVDAADKNVHSSRIGPGGEDVMPNILKLRDLKHVEEATTDPFAGHGNAIDRNATVKRSSLSMRTLMRMEDEEEKHGKPFPPKGDVDVDSFSSAIASKSFSVQLEEIKSSRKKPWSFTHQGKISNNVVVMFPNPTFDETTPPMTTPPEYQQKAVDASITKQSSLDEKAMLLPSTMHKNEALSSDRKGSFPKKEKIVRLSPCVTTRTSIAQKPQPQLTPTIACASTSKRASSAKKQKWLCNSINPPSPTLIRRLPEAHEMKEIKQASQNYEDEEDRHPIANVYMDNAPDSDNASDSLRRSWSFSNPSMDARTTSDTRRSSLNPTGGQAFSFLSRHFHAWKLASKQDK
ncbi:hypothetical protein GOP47_0014635 [Adiantum capillus-veneris]|uniref:Uncharacterized protein n=1 Tax=Adiantum capillus-veneris TaxID=13818 RepID=A0A9D4UM60_ADICA|nr:hypothetical protein GOP47_0014635 [Adiantum capillus-veneris]